MGDKITAGRHSLSSLLPPPRLSLSLSLSLARAAKTHGMGVGVTGHRYPPDVFLDRSDRPLRCRLVAVHQRDGHAPPRAADAVVAFEGPAPPPPPGELVWRYEGGKAMMPSSSVVAAAAAAAAAHDVRGEPGAELAYPRPGIHHRSHYSSSSSSRQRR